MGGTVSTPRPEPRRTVTGPPRPKSRRPVTGPPRPKPRRPVTGSPRPRPRSPVTGPPRSEPRRPVTGPPRPKPRRPVTGPPRPKPRHPVAGPSRPKPVWVTFSSFCRQKANWSYHENTHTSPAAGKLITVATPRCHGTALVRLGPPLREIISPQIYFNPIGLLFRFLSSKGQLGRS